VASGFDALPVNPDGSPRPVTDEAKDQIDCVLCHGKTYNGGGPDGQRVVLSDELDHNYWSLASTEDARTVGDPVEPSACKRCHVNSGGKVFSANGTMSKSYKYGTDYVAEPYQFTYDNGSGMMETATINGDVHAAAGIRCAECHFIKDEEGNTQHKVQYGPHNVSWAHDQVPDNFSCTTSNCHSLTPHSESSNYYKVYLDTHTQALACQTCHITKTGGLMKRDLRRPILPDEDAHFYEFKDEVHYGVDPEYRWFNGNSGGWEAVLEGPCPIGPQGSKQGNRNNDNSKITPFKRYQALLWFDLGLRQPVPYTLTDFIVDGDLEAAANNGMNASGWLPDGRSSYNFRLRRLMGLVIPFPMACALKIDHGVQTGQNALGYATQGNVSGCNHCHSTENKSFWKFLGYSRRELRELQMPRTP
jgi:hypothetical protein